MHSCLKYLQHGDREGRRNSETLFRRRDVFVEVDDAGVEVDAGVADREGQRTRNLDRRLDSSSGKIGVKFLLAPKRRRQIVAVDLETTCLAVVVGVEDGCLVEGVVVVVVEEGWRWCSK